MARKILKSVPRFSIGDLVTSTRDIGVAIDDEKEDGEVTFKEAKVVQVMDKRFPYTDACYYRVEITNHPENQAFRAKYTWINSIVVHSDYIKASKDLYVDPDVFI